MLLVDPRNSSSLEFMNSQWSDYNRCINLPFVYQKTSLEYYEPMEDWDMEDDYDLSILNWVDANYLRTFMYEHA